MDYNFKFPKDLYSEVRIEERYRIWLTIRNGKIENDGEYTEVGAMVRVFDGNMWYTATTNTLEDIQSQLLSGMVTDAYLKMTNWYLLRTAF